MYLKRLEIKGFKSFADRCVINLEPGISAIVGPNGSGKSNICDAILWVLGERNAKSLRGGVMEDVIFTGSAKRCAVSLADVSLVLDNSDGVLPVDYNEVVVSRRLYRNGDGEYLINGVSARRLDVLDILHDSGIGTDTNSIISQGHLDYILQSKPYDRRTLIEEAAGVLKHKQRKTRSHHKLQKMNFNMQRIGDVMSEIERQLKPLRIKAKRAAAYDGLIRELNQLSLEIAVDDLKIIKTKWDNINSKKNIIQENVDKLKEDCQLKDLKLSELRSKMSTYNSDVVEYSEKQRRLNSYINKLSTSAILLEQKSSNLKDKIKVLSNTSIDNDDTNSTKKQILNEIIQIQNSFEDTKNEYNYLLKDCAKSKLEVQNAIEDLNKFQDLYKNKNNELQKFHNEESKNRQIINNASENLVKYQSKTASYKVKIDNLQEKIKQNNSLLNAALKDMEKSNNALSKTQKNFDKNEKKILDLEAKYNEKKSTLDNIKLQLSDVDSNILAIEKILETNYQDSSEATKWLNKNKDKFNNVELLSDLIDIPDKYLNLLELLLGSFSTSFLANNDDIYNINKTIKNNASGNLRIISLSKNLYTKKINENAKKIANKFNGICLSDEVKINNDFILGVISNVVVFQNSKLAFEASKNSDGLCCVSLDGTIIYADGRHVIGEPFFTDEENDSYKNRNILSYKKNLNNYKKKSLKLNKDKNSLIIELKNITKVLDQLNDNNSELKNDLANNKAEYNYACKYKLDLEDAIIKQKESLDLINKEFNDLKNKYNLDNPAINQAKQDLPLIIENIKKCQTWLNAAQNDLNNKRELSEQKKQAYNDLLTKKAAFAERLSSQEVNLMAAKVRLKKHEEKEIENKEELIISKILCKKFDSLSESLSRLSKTAKNTLENLDNNFNRVNAAAVKIQKETDSAINNANSSRKIFDEENDKLSNIQIELGRLEVQVQNAVDAIDKIEEISVDSALNMPDIENREESLKKQAKIRRRIANMGTINPDAKQEYNDLKERYDFLNNQIHDLNSAKLSLSKIDKIIEERMKDDFINTFNEVNNNFKEIFAVLFPGGKARLELEDNNDIENSGVEVKAQPHGKHISKMSLLSGGEKSLVALCLLFAVYKKRSTPFYILDEVEAALDDTNLRRLIKYLDNLKNSTQLIMITHQRRTMEMADVLYGVSMKNDGVTRVVSQRLEKDNKFHNIDR